MGDRERELTPDVSWEACPWCWGSAVILTPDLSHAYPCRNCLGMGQVPIDRRKANEQPQEWLRKKREGG